MIVSIKKKKGAGGKLPSFSLLPMCHFRRHVKWFFKVENTGLLSGNLVMDSTQFAHQHELARPIQNPLSLPILTHANHLVLNTITRSMSWGLRAKETQREMSTITIVDWIEINLIHSCFDPWYFKIETVNFD